MKTVQIQTLTPFSTEPVIAMKKCVTVPTFDGTTDDHSTYIDTGSHPNLGIKTSNPPLGTHIGSPSNLGIHAPQKHWASNWDH